MMPSHKPKRLLRGSDDKSQDFPPTSVIQEISHSINARLAQGRAQRKIIKHNLEAGLIAENVFRQLLRDTLPLRYGVAKGKLVHPDGRMSKHLDVIIYDAMNCPALFIDENKNQILPIGSVFAVIEVKSHTKKSVLVEAFAELSSVRDIHLGAVCSSNELVDHIPPTLMVFSFEDSRTLDAIHDNFVELNLQHPQDFSSSAYSQASPGFRGRTGENYMVHSIWVAGKGEVYHMLNGETAIGKWGEFTAAMMINSLLSNLPQVELKPHNPHSYLSWLNAGARDIYGPDYGLTK